LLSGAIESSAGISPPAVRTPIILMARAASSWANIVFWMAQSKRFLHGGWFSGNAETKSNFIDNPMATSYYKQRFRFHTSKFGAIKMSLGAKRAIGQGPTAVSVAVASFRVVAAGAVVLSLASRDASATCGDYVMIGGRHANHSGESAKNEATENQATGPGANDGLSRSDRPRVPPCNSPTCQRRRSLPVAPDRGNREAGGPDWVYWQLAVFFIGTDRSRARFLESFLELEGHLLPLLRPPCARS
jgi:hypothetical protein